VRHQKNYELVAGTITGCSRSEGERAEAHGGGVNHSAYGSPWLIMCLCTNDSVLTMGLDLLWLSRVAQETRHSEGQKPTAQIHFLHASIWNDDAPIFSPLRHRSANLQMEET
jgi:hypothetical protein